MKLNTYLINSNAAKTTYNKGNMFCIKNENDMTPTHMIIDYYRFYLYCN